MKKNRNALDANFIEGMACVSGCIGGAGNLTHGEKNRAAVDKYGHEAMEKTIEDAVSVFSIEVKCLFPIETILPAIRFQDCRQFLFSRHSEKETKESSPCPAVLWRGFVIKYHT